MDFSKKYPTLVPQNAEMAQLINDTYKSIAAMSQGLYKDKGSKFISFAFPVTREEEIKDILEKNKKEYHDARHHCYAYRLGINGEDWRFNDDGEPSSTAGKPIFGQLLSNELSDILVVVVRYFGGIKLGVPGLIKAYKAAAADAIAAAEIVEKTATELISVSFGYEVTDKVMRLLREMGLTPEEFVSEMECTIRVRVRLRDAEAFKQKVAQIKQF